MMRFLRIAVSAFFAVTLIVFSYFFISNKLNSDDTIPVITVEGDMLDVSIKATNEDLLKGVTAHDDKDGDITSKVIVESISKFTEKGVCKVTYAVCDGDNHVANASRKIRYTDYVSPSFGLYGDLCFSIYESVGVSNILYATDCLDGNITRDMIVTSSNFVASTPGEFSVEAVVTNSKGDQSYIKLPLIVEDRSLSAPKIYLTKYLINIKKGEQPDYASMVRSIEDYSGNAITPAVRVVSEVDPNNDGTYLVHYYASDTEGYEGHSVLTVIVGN